MVAIDGSRGEGGGRILRTALGLFRPIRYEVEGESGKSGRVRIRP